MAITKVTIWRCTCERCGHTWAPRALPPPPRLCPKCKSFLWNQPPEKSARKAGGRA